MVIKLTLHLNFLMAIYNTRPFIDIVKIYTEGTNSFYRLAGAFRWIAKQTDRHISQNYHVIYLTMTEDSINCINDKKGGKTIVTSITY